MSSKRMTIIVLLATLILSTSMVSASLPPLNLEAAREKINLIIPAELTKEQAEALLIEEVPATGPKDWAPGMLIVRLSDSASISSADSGLNTALAKLGGKIEGKVEMVNKAEGAGVLSSSKLKLAFVKFDDEADVFELAKEVSMIPGVLYAEPDYKMYPDAIIQPTDSGFTLGRQYYLLNDGVKPYYSNWLGTAGSDDKALAAWQYANTDFGLDSSSVTVAIIDQGVAYWHYDLYNNMWRNSVELAGVEGVDDDGNGYVDDVFGVNFYNGASQGINEYVSGYFPWMDDYHGTHVAGTISAEWNGWGAAGMTVNTKIMSLKFLGPEGGYTSDAIRALQYAAMMGADLTSNSWGGGEPEQSLSDAIKASGMLFITSAGNDGNNNDYFGHYPSSYANPESPYYCENIISVAATDANDNLVAFSNYGAGSVQIAAPGFYVYASYPYYDSLGNPASANAWMSGTSMATPQVSAVAAMLIAQDKAHPAYSMPQYADPYPTGNWDTIKEVILNSAEKKSQLEGLVSTAGRVSMYNALTYQRLPSVDTIAATPIFSDTAPVDVELSVTLNGGDAKPSQVSELQHNWSLYSYDTYRGITMLPLGVTATGETASISITEPGSYYIKYEMVDGGIPVTTSYKHVLVAPEEYVLLVQDDQWNGKEYMSQSTEIGFLLLNIPYIIVNPPMDIPSDIPNIVFWTTSYTTTGVINEDDAHWLISFLNEGGRLFLSSFEMLNMIDGYYGESALAPETAEELLELLKIEAYLTDHTYLTTGTLPVYEDTANVPGDTIIDDWGLHLDLEYYVWELPNFGDVITDFGPGAYPILLTLNAGAIDTPERAAYGLSYAGYDYRLIFMGVPIEAFQGEDYYNWLFDSLYESNGDMDNFIYFLASSWLFLQGEGPDRLITWLDEPQTGETYSLIDFEWGLQDVPETTHNASLWYRYDASSDWLPVTLTVPGEDLEYSWTDIPELAGTQYQVKIEMRDASNPTRVAYDFAGPLAFWPVSTSKGASAGVDRNNGLVNFYVNAAKPGTLYVYDLSGVQLFAQEVEAGLSTVTWDMMFRGKRVARGLYAFRVVYEDGTASELGRVLINF